MITIITIYLHLCSISCLLRIVYSLSSWLLSPPLQFWMVCLVNSNHQQFAICKLFLLISSSLNYTNIVYILWVPSWKFSSLTYGALCSFISLIASTCNHSSQVFPSLPQPFFFLIVVWQDMGYTFMFKRRSLVPAHEKVVASVSLDVRATHCIVEQSFSLLDAC